MFNIGFGELAVICIILILAVGPERLPQMMKSVGKTMRTLRQASRDIRASTGLDELMRDDYLDTRPRPDRPAPPVGPAPLSREAGEPPPEPGAEPGATVAESAGKPTDAV